MNRGIGYDGNIGTSTANQELVINRNGWTDFGFYEFSFLNSQDCTVKINGNSIPLSVDQGVQIDADDAPIKSFIIVQSGIDYKWFGRY